MTTLRIILVDDDAIIGGLLAEMLRDIGHIVCAVEATENAAVTSALREQPDLMIVDVDLGHGSGINAMDRITRSRPLAHVFMSGSKFRQPPQGSVMLLKPFARHDLVQAIDNALDIAS